LRLSDPCNARQPKILSNSASFSSLAMFMDVNYVTKFICNIDLTMCNAMIQKEVTVLYAQ